MRKKLKSIRVEKGLTQEELALKVGISRAHCTKIEIGMSNPSLAVAMKLKQVLEYINDDLFTVS